MMDLAKYKVYKTQKQTRAVLIPIGDNAKGIAHEVVQDMREKHSLNVDIFHGLALKKVMHKANLKGYDYCFFYGDEEIETHSVKIKNMKTGGETIVKFSDLKKFLDGSSD